MNIKEVAKTMQDIEFVLHSLKNQDSLQQGEVEAAHVKSQMIIEQYLLPSGVLEE